MPDLSLKASHEYWSQFADPNVYRAVTFMEGVEPWTLDGDPAFEEALQKLSEKLDANEELKVTELNKEDLFIKIGCNIRMSRTLRLLQAIDSIEPGSASKTLIHAEESSHHPHDTPGIFLRRNLVFERLRLLARVFAPQKLDFVTRVLEGEDHD